MAGCGQVTKGKRFVTALVRGHTKTMTQRFNKLIDCGPRVRTGWRLKRLSWRNTTTFVAGNRATLLPHGGDFFPALLAAIAQAQRQITLEYYIVRGDTLGLHFAAALIAAVKRGVAVYLIYDYVGSFDTPTAYFQQLEQGGVQVLCFNRPRFGRVFGRIDKRNHRKIAIIDDQLAFLGGLNVGDEYSGYGESPERWRDCGIHLAGPVVQELQRLFWKSWQGEGGTVSAPETQPVPDPAGCDGVLVVSGGPNHRRSMIKRSYQLAITHAEQRLAIVTPYFLPGPRLVRIMLKAARRGVKVTLLIPGKSDVPLLKIVSHPYLNLLLKSGVEVYERGGTFLHAKLMLVDDLWTMVGSANFDQRSFYRNYETNLIIESREFSGKVAEMLEGDLARSTRLTADLHQQRKWYEALLEWLVSPLKRFL